MLSDRLDWSRIGRDWTRLEANGPAGAEPDSKDVKWNAVESLGLESSGPAGSD